MKNNVFSIKQNFKYFNSVENNTASIYIYGYISSYWDGISSKRIKETLDTITADEIHVHINSGGGDVFESIAIHNLFKRHPSKIIIHVDALAGSGASLIAMAGDEIIMPANTMMMIHKAATFIFGNADKLRKEADVLDKIDIAVKASYMPRFAGEESELEVLLANEEWLNADECKALGFCDIVAEAIEEPPKEPEMPDGQTEEPEEHDASEETVANILAKYSAQATSSPLNKKQGTKNILNVIAKSSR
ncbi:Clp protease [Listeria fleischmannii FSL S10-1203]|uniref:Clp protease n=1 Tax=Listeria fleischmannii FSL S10-1203 TaxID=1265822 RepID=W7DF40_9LIST|nr:Clp protease [Listeria fleischmannii FSL S10-1203]